MTSLQIAYQNPGSLHAHPCNALEHSDRQIEQIASSIQAFGFNSPVLVDANRQILAGHGRVLAAVKLGLNEVPTVSIEHLSEGQRRAFMLADNRLGELSTWNEPILAAELEALSVIDEPFEITDTGFELPRIDVLIEEQHKPKPEDDPADAPVDEASVEHVVRMGDLWLLGRHKLFVGNALEHASFQALLGRTKADLVFIDPPFNVPRRCGCKHIEQHDHLNGSLLPTGEFSLPSSAQRSLVSRALSGRQISGVI